jgi:hypothetical protein
VAAPSYLSVPEAPIFAPYLLWNPFPPPDNESQQLLCTEPLHRTEYFSIHHYMPFGGSNGSRLKHLCRVTALIDGRTGLHGLSFSYDDGLERLFGQRYVLGSFGELRYCVEQSVSINGGCGEYITSCEVFTRNSAATQRRTICALGVRIAQKFRPLSGMLTRLIFSFRLQPITGDFTCFALTKIRARTSWRRPRSR